MKKYSVPALEKAMAILDLISASRDPLTITEIHQSLGIPKATVFMILNVLESHQAVHRGANGRYSLGVKLYNLGMTYMTKTDLRQSAIPHMEALSRETGFACHLGVVSDDSVVFTAKVEQQTFIKFSTYEGLRSDIHITSLGKAIAAHLPPEELKSIVSRTGLRRYTARTITTMAAFERELAVVRERGYALEDEESEIGVRCVGAPIFREAGQVVAAVSLTMLKQQLPDEAVPAVGEKVMEAARTISMQLGWSGPGPEPDEAGL